MTIASSPRERRATRHARIRRKVIGTAERPRLAVFRSNKHMYAQLIDDVAGRTLVSASTMADEVSGAKMDAAGEIGKRLASRAKEAGIENVVFDRGGFRYHGRVAAIADAARNAGLRF